MVNPTHTDFWEMARDIRAYCKSTGLAVVVDDRVARFVGFSTACAANDPRYRTWTMRGFDAIATASDRPDAFDGLCDAELHQITNPWFLNVAGRSRIATFFSTGVLPGQDPTIAEQATPLLERLHKVTREKAVILRELRAVQMRCPHVTLVPHDADYDKCVDCGQKFGGLPGDDPPEG